MAPRVLLTTNSGTRLPGPVLVSWLVAGLLLAWLAGAGLADERLFWLVEAVVSVLVVEVFDGLGVTVAVAGFAVEVEVLPERKDSPIAILSALTIAT